MTDDRFTDDTYAPAPTRSGKPTPEEIDRYLREVRKRLGIAEPEKPEGGDR